MTVQPGVELLLDSVLPDSPLVIEASAGTGKTYSLSALVVRYVAERGVTPSSLLIVTFTRVAAAELRDRTRRALVLARDACATGVVPADQSWMEVLLHPDTRDVHHERLAAAVASFDEATITTIHGFCQQALGQIGVRAGRAGTAEISASSVTDLVNEVCLDLVIATIRNDPETISWQASKAPAPPTTVFTQLRRTVVEVLASPNALFVPTPAQSAAFTQQSLKGWCDLVTTAVEEVHRRREMRGELGFDDLVLGLRDALAHEHHGAQSRNALAQRFELVFVDESQDTDPVQWQVLEEAFEAQMITVGDPKQAIYRFRGADVHSYIDHAHRRSRVHLSTNHRSDPDLVAATNQLMAGTQLGHHEILVRPVRAVDGRPPARVSPGAALQIRRMPVHPDLCGSNGYVVANKAADAVLIDVATAVIELLTGPTIDTGHGERAVEPSDIAVLTGTGRDAEAVMQTLISAGVPAVRTKTGSVLETDAVDEWRTLLFALERPSEMSRVCAAALGAFFEADVAHIDPSNAHNRIAEFQRRCVEWAAELPRMSWLAWYDKVRAESNVVASQLRLPGGERMLTDLDHIAELLAVDLASARSTAVLARRRLEHLVENRNLTPDESSPEMRRIDSDARAVQISTIHSSKGLEYPIVLLPFVWKSGKQGEVAVFNDDDGRRVVDTATPFKWSSAEGVLNDLADREEREHLARFGDNARVLYVGLTRARHRTIAWWAPTQGAKLSAFGSVLFDRDDAMKPLNTRLDAGSRMQPPAIFEAGDDQAVEAAVTTHFDALVEWSDGRISVTTFDPTREVQHFDRELDDVDVSRLAVAVGRDVNEPHWKRWSFTSITRTTPGAVHAPVKGGADEVTDSDGDGPRPEPVTAVPAPEMPWASVAGGADFGTVVHDVLERVDPTSHSLRDDLDRIVARRLSRSGLDLDTALVVEGVMAAMHTPLGPDFSHRRLVDIPRSDRLAELRFDLPLALDTLVPTAAIGDVLLRTLLEDDPQRPYATKLANGRFHEPLAGFIQGSIDAVLRVDDGDGPRFMVVDYKTNRLHDRDDADALAAYARPHLPSAMAHSDYPLQALLYSVALHRYLRWRMVGYEPERHLGGIGYLYLRGMVGPATPTVDGYPHGVFSWQPPAATILALDDLLAEGVTV